MKIAFLIGDLRKGGAERVIANLGNSFCENDDVTILMTKKGKIEYSIDERINLLSLDNFENIKSNIIINNIRRIRQMKKIILEQQPEIIVSFLKEPTARILILKLLNFRIRKIPLIVSIRNNPKHVFKTILDKLMLKTLYNLPEGFVFQTEDAKLFFSKKIQKKSIVIPNPINPEFICERFKGEREKTIVTVGRLTNQKNQKLLIDAFSDISEKYSNYNLYIYGEGELEGKLNNYIKEKKMTNRIFLKGTTCNIKKELYKSGMFIMTSDYEGMPNALMEAMALGLPCISTDCPCGGPSFLINDKYNGLLIPVNGKEELKKAIEMLIDDKEFANKLGENANKIKETLNPDKINKIWDEYIKKERGKKCK